MRNGYVVPPRYKQKASHRKQMSFEAYLQLRMFLDDQHSKPNSVITSHDKDTMNYVEGYHAFRIVKKASEEDLRLISGLLALLYTKHVISKHEEIEFVNKYLRGLKHE